MKDSYIKWPKKNEQIGAEKVFLNICSLIVELRESLNIACKENDSVNQVFIQSHEAWKLH